MTVFSSTTRVHDEGPAAMGWVALPCRLLLGGLFVLAAVLKVSSPMQFAEAIAGFKIVPAHLVGVVTFVIPWTELVAGAMLLLGWWSRAAALVISALLLSFIAGVISVIIRGIDTKCSCFGDLEWPCGAGVGWCQVIRNLVMLAMAGVVLRWGPGPLAAEYLLTRDGPRRG